MKTTRNTVSRAARGVVPPGSAGGTESVNAVAVSGAWAGRESAMRDLPGGGNARGGPAALPSVLSLRAAAPVSPAPAAQPAYAAKPPAPRGPAPAGPGQNSLTPPAGSFILEGKARPGRPEGPMVNSSVIGADILARRAARQAAREAGPETAFL